jgi:hypothetical protein
LAFVKVYVGLLVAECGRCVDSDLRTFPSVVGDVLNEGDGSSALTGSRSAPKSVATRIFEATHAHRLPLAALALPGIRQVQADLK